jgi:hypothetical protein
MRTILGLVAGPKKLKEMANVRVYLQVAEALFQREKPCICKTKYGVKNNSDQSCPWLLFNFYNSFKPDP